jgi:predicted PurR-regulated permease PerM
VQTYLGVCTLASAIMAVITYALLKVMGVDFAGFWALAMFVLTYIPTVGAVGVVLPAAMALAQFGTFGPALIIAIVLFAVHFLLTSVIETLLLGRTLDLSPFAIIVSLTFWGLVWGVGGLFLAVPLTGAIAIICRHVEGLEWFGEVLAGSKPVRARRRLKFGSA